MKKLFTLSPILLILLVTPLAGNSQCKHFAKQVCKKELKPFIHNGNFNAAILTEGETAEMYKTFYADQTYRILICGSATMPHINFQVLDINRNVLFDNKQEGYKPAWDFVPESSQQLIISLKVENSEVEGGDPVSGCVAIMIGIKEESGS
jgi:hypothetical protein